MTESMEQFGENVTVMYNFYFEVGFLLLFLPNITF